VNDYEKLLYKCNRQKNQLRKQKIKILEYKEEIKKTEELKIEYSKSIDFISQKANKEIERLKERIEYLERSNNRREDEILELRQENANLDNIINELEKYIKTDAKIELYKDVSGLRTFVDGQDLLNKLQELKGSDK